MSTFSSFLVHKISLTVVLVLSLAVAHIAFGAYLLPKIMPIRVKSVHAKMVSIGNLTDQASGRIIASAALIDMPMVTLTAPDEVSSVRFDSAPKGSAELVFTRRGTILPIGLSTLSIGYLPSIKLRDLQTNLSVWAVRIDDSGSPVIEKKTP